MRYYEQDGFLCNYNDNWKQPTWRILFEHDKGYLVTWPTQQSWDHALWIPRTMVGAVPKP